MQDIFCGHLFKKVINMHSQVYSGLRLIFAILRNFRLASAHEPLCKYSIFSFYRIGQKKVSLGPLLRSKNDENAIDLISINIH